MRALLVVGYLAKALVPPLVFGSGHFGDAGRAVGCAIDGVVFASVCGLRDGFKGRSVRPNAMPPAGQTLSALPAKGLP